MVGQQFGSHASSHSSSMTSLSRTPTTTGSRSENSRDASSSPSLVDSTSTDAPHESCRDGGRAGGVPVMAPKEWTIHELEYHLHEHRTQEGIQVKKGKSQTSLREHMTGPECGSPQEAGPARPFGPAPEDASNAKCHHHGLKRAAISKIYQISECHPMDPVGFGKHSSLTYQEVAQQHPGYCDWVTKTAMEGDSCLLLQRLATWLEQRTVANPVKVVSPGPRTRRSQPRPPAVWRHRLCRCWHPWVRC